MRILITGAGGFIGRNLVSQLSNIRDGFCPANGVPRELEILEYDIHSPEGALEEYCRDCDFVFHLAGVNRPKDDTEFMDGNLGFLNRLLDGLRNAGNLCPIVLSSSIQAERDNPYGASKKAAEDALREYGEASGAKVMIYRFPNVFGKWCRPNYNSAVATFCHNIARDLPITVNDRETVLTLVYIDDVVNELLCALIGQEHREDGLCYVPVTHREKLGHIADLLHSFRESREDLGLPCVADEFARKLYAAYLSYLPEQEFAYGVKMNCDARGSFTELFRTADRGQFSVNITRPGYVKGNHWHHTKNEKFIVVAGEGVIRFRNYSGSEVIEYRVSGEDIKIVDIPTGYTHSIENTGDCDLVTVMWCSECFDPEHPDTFRLEV